MHTMIEVYACGFCENVVAAHTLRRAFATVAGVNLLPISVKCDECGPGYEMRREIFDVRDSKTRCPA